MSFSRNSSPLFLRWRLLERKRTTLLTDPQSVAVSNPSLTMSSDHSNPTLTYPHSPSWPTSHMLDPRQYWEENLSRFDLASSSAPGQQHNHARAHNNVELLGSAEQSSVSHPESAQHAVNLPPPFHYSSSSLSSALSSPHTFGNMYVKSTAASSYQTGKHGAAPLPSAPAPPATNAPANTPAVFHCGVEHLDPPLVNTSQSTQATDYTQHGHHASYENHVAQGQYNDICLSVAPTPAHSPVPAQHTSEYYSPPSHDESSVQSVHHQLISDGASPSKLSLDPRYSHPTVSQGPSISLAPSGLGPIHETGNYYAAHRHQQLEHDLRHFAMSSSDSPTTPTVHSEYYASPSSSNLCSPVSPVDAAPHPHNQYYRPSEHAVLAHQDIGSLSRPATTTPEGCRDYYLPKGQPPPKFRSLLNESELEPHRTSMPVVETCLPTGVPRNLYLVSSTQPSESVTPPSTYELPGAIGSAAKRGPPPDDSSPNPDDPNPRPAARPRTSIARKRPDLHAPLRLSSDLPATNE